MCQLAPCCHTLLNDLTFLFVSTMLDQALTLHPPMTKQGPLPVSQQMHCISRATLK